MLINIFFTFFPFSYYIEQTSGSAIAAVPDVPYFGIERVPSESGYGKAKVVWHPIYSGSPGSHFFVQYRKKGEPSFQKTDEQINEDHIEVGGLEPDHEYEFRVVSVDGQHETPSEIKSFDSSGGGNFT